MQAHQRIEEDQPRAKSSHGFEQPGAIGGLIQAQSGRGDDMQIDLGERDAAMAREGRDPLTDDRQRIFRQVG